MSFVTTADGTATAGQDYVAKSQTTAGLADIRGGIVVYEERIQNIDGTASGGPSSSLDIGLPPSTARCSTIAATGNWTDASGQRIICTPRPQNKTVYAIAIICSSLHLFG